MKTSVLLIALLVAFVSAAPGGPPGGPDMMNDPAAKQVMEAMEAIRTDLASMKSSGKVDDKKLIESLKKAVGLMNEHVDKAPAGAQPMIKAHITDLETKVKSMDQSGKFDESALECKMPPKNKE